VLGVTRDKEYDLTKGQKGSKTLYFTANPNGEAELITAYLAASSKARKKIFEFDFSSIEIKGRNSKGNTLTKYPVRKIQLKSSGKSTLGGSDIWYDSTIGRLNRDSRGKFLGNFKPEDKILVITKDGSYRLTSYDISNRYDVEMIMLINKFEIEMSISAVYFHGGHKSYYIKRFQIETLTTNKKFGFISEDKGSRLEFATEKQGMKMSVLYDVKRKDAKKSEEFNIDDLIDVKGWKAIGNKISTHKIKKINLLNGIVTENEPPLKAKEVEKLPAKSSVNKEVIAKKLVIENNPEDRRKVSDKQVPENTTMPKLKQDVSSSKKENVKKADKEVLKDSEIPSSDKIPEKSDNETMEKQTIEKDDTIEVGSTIDLDFDKSKNNDDQLGLFNN
jgi:topoisomerase-4 subunit A